uniref:Uncharacterized protein n=1 Tax=Acrobeloides nanus TaxID=290746 RepID=A0A914D9Q2_9BILA
MESKDSPKEKTVGYAQSHRQGLTKASSKSKIEDQPGESSVQILNIKDGGSNIQIKPPSLNVNQVEEKEASMPNRNSEDNLKEEIQISVSNVEGNVHQEGERHSEMNFGGKVASLSSSPVEERVIKDSYQM